MKTKPNKITHRSARKLSSILAAVISIFLGLSELAQAGGPPTLFWDGPNLIPGMVEGGNGVWSPPFKGGNDNWCDVNGNNNTQWQQGANATFETIGGTVTVDDAFGDTIFFGILRFVVNGYQIVATTGSSLGLTSDGLARITTDPGVTATIRAPLTDLEGASEFTKDGLGTLILSGTNTYTGQTVVSEGILNIQNGSALGATTGRTFVDSGATLQLQGGISVGTEDLAINGAGAAGQNGALVNVSGTNNYGGLLTLDADTTISSDSGTLNLTNTGTITGGDSGMLNLTKTGTITGGFDFGLTLTGAGDGTISSIIGTGTGTVTKNGAGTWTLFGENTYTGATTVDAGTLLVDGSLAVGSAVTVNSGATLGGTGTAAGAVTIADGGILAPGNSPGTPRTFTVGSLSLGNASLLNYDLGTPGVIGLGTNDLTMVNTNLTLDGVLNTTALAGFGPGGYRLFNYGGALTDNTLDIGIVPAGFNASNFIVVTGVPNEVDLLVIAGPLPPSVQFWA